MQTDTLRDGIIRQWNFANTLTALRPILVLPVIGAAFYGQYWPAFILIVFAGVTDYLDGAYARYMNATTDLGRVFDPLADKIYIDLVLLAAVFISMDPALLVLWMITISYDLDNTYQRRKEIGEALMGFRTETVLPVNFLSKWKTAFLFVVVGVLYAPLTVRNLLPIDYSILAYTAAFMVALCWWKNRKKWIFELFE